MDTMQFDIGLRIKEIRKEANFTVKELADKVGITREFLSAVENNTKPISFTTLSKILNELNISLEDFFNFKNLTILSPGLNQLLEVSKGLTDGQYKLLIEIAKEFNNLNKAQ